FEIPNKILVILGSNGAGKTTLAKVLCGLIETQNVRLKNTSLSDISYDERVELLNYIPPKLEVFDEYMSVEEFLALNKIYDSHHIDDVLKKLQIEYLKNKNCKRLSSGESQLVLIASAILHDAKYTILDEPTSNLDPQKLKNVFEILSHDKTMKNKIIITHNLNLAYKLGFDIVFVKNGTIAFNGTSEEFFTQENLNSVYDNTVKKISDNIVVDI
ncbi:MAG: ABC transporter ATP-binding protein, partial [Arcobacteraceae bacterium]